VSTPVLWFRGSHFNKKARWALDWKGILHVRRSLLPGWHVARVLSLTRQTKVPVLVCEGGDVVADSTRIIERLEGVRPEPPLYPADSAERRRTLELEEFFDEELERHTRRMFFFEALDYPDYVVALFADGQRPATRTLYRAAPKETTPLTAGDCTSSNPREAARLRSDARVRSRYWVS
jgi:glutathione S-transferase